MDWDWIMNLPQYRHGVTFFGVLATLPAVVSGNMLIHEIERLAQGRKGASWKAALMNAGVLVVSVAIIAGVIWQWL